MAWPAPGHHVCACGCMGLEGRGAPAEVSEVLMAWPAPGHHVCACGCMGLEGRGAPAEVSEVLMAWPALGHHAVLVAAWDWGGMACSGSSY